MECSRHSLGGGLEDVVLCFTRWSAKMSRWTGGGRRVSWQGGCQHSVGGYTCPTFNRLAPCFVGLLSCCLCPVVGIAKGTCRRGAFSLCVWMVLASERVYRDGVSLRQGAHSSWNQSGPIFAVRFSMQGSFVSFHVVTGDVLLGVLVSCSEVGCSRPRFLVEPHGGATDTTTCTPKSLQSTWER